MPLRWRKSRPAEGDPDLIFVHGILSKKHNSWGADTGKAWPSVVQNDKAFPSCGVASFDFHSTIRSGAFSVSDIANDLWDSLLEAGVIAPGRLPVFVCHSMGGLVVRRLLVQRHAELKAAGVTCAGLFLVASPSLGSRWARAFAFVPWLLGHAQGMALSSAESNTWLQDLRNDFVTLRDKGEILIVGKEIVEHNSYRIWRFLRIPRVVTRREAAVFFSEHRVITGTDHSTIAAPADASAQQHVLLRTFVDDCLNRCSAIVVGIPADTPFRCAVEVLAKHLGLDVVFQGFTENELQVSSANERSVCARTAEGLLEALRQIFPFNSIRSYRVAIMAQTALLSIL
jgi:pimeloyl-ACP methyl ester carboxylesterase